MSPTMNRSNKFEQISRHKNIIEEVRNIVLLIFPDYDFFKIKAVYRDILNLFNGRFIGYRECNTYYHDLKHTEDCILEMARLIHGACINGIKFSPRSIELGLISACMHDTGYIQTADDISGTGAKYTLTHVERSIDFIEKYFSLEKYSSDDFIFCKNCLLCTEPSLTIGDIQFQCVENELMGKILGAADLIGQMADSTYLEKLPLLFLEFQEGGVTGFETEFNLLQKTPSFWEFTKDRIKTELDNVDQYLRDHFWVRWGIDRDLDREAIEQNIACLHYIVDNYPNDYRRYLHSENHRQNIRNAAPRVLHRDQRRTTGFINLVTS